MRIQRALKLILATFVGSILIIVLAIHFGQTQTNVSLKPHHVALSVPNFEETIQWYQDKLGFTVTLRHDIPDLSTQQALLEQNGFRIEVFQRNNSTRSQPPTTNVPDDLLTQGYKHIGFIVDDLDTLTTELKRRDVKFLLEPTVVDYLGWKLGFIQDNNGNLIELIQELNR